MSFFKKIKDSFQRRVASFWSRYTSFSQRQKISFFILITLVISVSLVFGIVRPIHRSVFIVDKQIQLKERIAANNLKDGAQKPQISLAYNRLKEQMGIPPDGNEKIRSAMLQDIEQSAREHGISLTEIKPQVSTEHDGFAEFFVRIQAEGSMTQVVSFFQKLFGMQKLYYVETLKISPHSDDVNKVKANVSLGRSALIIR